jgi:hypothetical protein
MDRAAGMGCLADEKMPTILGQTAGKACGVSLYGQQYKKKT